MLVFLYKEQRSLLLIWLTTGSTLETSILTSLRYYLPHTKLAQSHQLALFYLDSLLPKKSMNISREDSCMIYNHGLKKTTREASCL